MSIARFLPSFFPAPLSTRHFHLHLINIDMYKQNLFKSHCYIVRNQEISSLLNFKAENLLQGAKQRETVYLKLKVY